jgi:hypothetical protein
MSRPAKQQAELKSTSAATSCREESVLDERNGDTEVAAGRLRTLAGAESGGTAVPWPRVPADRQQTILTLQRTHGNAFVGRLVDRVLHPSTGRPEAAAVRRASSPTALAAKDQIAVALKSRDPADVKAITDLDQATETDKLELIGILANQKTWVGPRDEAMIEQIWESFGDQLPRIMAARTALWKLCLEVGAELDDLPQVKALRTQFPHDVKAIVAGYLDNNRHFVTGELNRLGYSLEKPAGEIPPAADQIEETRQMQAMAAAIAGLQFVQEAARKTYVGYDLVFYDIPPMFPNSVGESTMRQAPEQRYEPVTFSPYAGRPPYEKAPPGSFFRPVAPSDEGGHFARYDDVKAQYDKADALIATMLKRYPVLYAISRAGKSATTDAFAGVADPTQARAQLAAAMWRLLADILKTQTKLEKGDLDPLDLTPVHAQLLGGVVPAPSGTRWNETLQKSVAEDLVKDHDFQNVLIALGLQTAAAALFALAPLSGGASLYLVLAGLAVTGAKLALSAEQFATLAQASRTSVTPGTELVQGGQVEDAALIVEADLVAAALAALTAVTLATIKGPSPPKQAVLPGKRPQRRRPIQEQRKGDQPPKRDVTPGSAGGRLRRPMPGPPAAAQIRADQPVSDVEETTEVLPPTKRAHGHLAARVNWTKQLSSAGWTSSIAGEDHGVFEGTLPGVKEPVVIKVYPKGHDTFERELRGAKAAERTGFGPKIHGQVDVDRPDKVAFAMERIPGGMTEAATKTPEMSKSEYEASEREAAYYRKKVTWRTVRDLQNYGDRLTFEGYYYSGDVQGLVAKDGRWRPVDFQSVRELPPETQPDARKAALARHGQMMDDARDELRGLAEQNEPSH